MINLGREQNCVVVLDGKAKLPEGAAVTVRFPAPVADIPQEQKQRIEIPLVRTNQPGSIELTSERIAEILDAEDVSARP